ncbi:alkane 1-monooxygenase [Jannaschia sp. Os4]|uniref:alkane 1-monooxygenase n=1 Tax=Jannaschia sp. Os4 TaxID=2807617 RepID=UPI00193993BF|nr:alkane 1-monooxygenase [Jannaschia sp. Os4]MBM2574831.1 alkane 1-monooxygenase [Jannaschia sp. Os4]
MKDGLTPYVLALGLSVGLLAAGVLAEGPWRWASWLWMAWVVAALDHFMQRPGAQPTGRVARYLPAALGLLHFPLLAGAVWSIAQGGWWLTVAVFVLASGLFFGQIMNSTAHELIHARTRWERAIGRWIYVTLLYGHQTTAHPLIHHVHAATPLDTNTSRYDESWWRFSIRAWRDSFRRGLALEKRRRVQRGDAPWSVRNPYWQYILGPFACMALAYGTLGPAGLAAYLAVGSMASLLLLMTDYVLHYGLRRRRRGDRWEPVGPKHSWNAPHEISGLLTLQGARHSDHHANPQRPYNELELDAGSMPMLPYALPVMVTLAFWPWYWRRMMNPRVHAVQGRHRDEDVSVPPRFTDAVDGVAA